MALIKVAGTEADYYNTATKVTQRKNVDGTFSDVSANGAARFSAPPLDFISYEDATYKYYCEAVPQTALDADAWRVVRKTIASGLMRHAGDGSLSYRATNISTVAALEYPA